MTEQLTDALDATKPMTEVDWITDRAPNEYDIDIFDCIAIPSPKGRKRKSMAVPIDLYQDGTPWHHTTKRRKNKLKKRGQANQANLFQIGTCISCLYFDGDFGGDGICRRNSPKPSRITENATWVHSWPSVAETDWCGEWRVKP